MDTSLFFHPKLVHIPMALGILMPFIAGGLILAWWRGWLPHRSWLLALALQAVLVGSGVLALRSGEAEEDRVERVVAERFIEAHEEAAQLFVGAGAGVLVLMALGAWLGDRRSARVAAGAATLGSLVVLGLGYRTGQAGGELVYRHGAAQAHVSPAPAGEAQKPAPLARDDDD